MAAESPFPTPAPRGFWMEEDNRRGFFEWFADEQGMNHLDDWYAYSNKDVIAKGGSSALRYYSDSLSVALSELFPAHDWKPWLFKFTPKRFWDDKNNRRKYLDWLGKELGFTRFEDWYDITIHEFRDNFGISLCSNQYQGQVSQIVVDNFDEYEWKRWLFHKVPQGYYEDWHNRKAAIDWLGNEIGIQTPEDWYKVEQKVFREYRLFGMLSHRYSSGMHNALSDIYPEVDWKPWLFDKCPNGYWRDQSNWDDYLEWFEVQMDITEPDQWYRITKDDFAQHSGASFLNSHFRGSPRRVAEYLYPDVEWEYWPAESGYWDYPEHVCIYLEHLAKKLDFNDPKDWYRITKKDFLENDGSGLLGLYDQSPSKIVSEFIEGVEWKPWLFGRAPNRFWNEPHNQRWYMDWVCTELGIVDLDQWYIYDRDVLKRYKGGGLLTNYSTSLARILVAVYPEHDWDYPRLLKIGKSQLQLSKIVSEIFPDDDVINNYKHPELRFSITNAPMELDIWLPSRKMAFEYQGEQHYSEFMRGKVTNSFAAQLEEVQRRDQEKRVACEEAGIILIEIPYSWDKSVESIRDIVQPHLRAAFRN